MRPRGTPKTILVVEDNDLKLVRQHRPDLIVMDIQLPGASGMEVTRWIKEDDDLKAIPIIAVTAFAMKGDQEKILESGCEAYVAKPISVAAFIKTVEQVLESSADGGQSCSGFGNGPPV